MANLKTLRRSAQLKFRAMISEHHSKGMVPACVYCGAVGNLTVDHVIPIYQGGTSSRDNLVPCCFRCNQKKGRLVWEPMYRGFIKWTGDSDGC